MKSSEPSRTVTELTVVLLEEAWAFIFLFLLASTGVATPTAPAENADHVANITNSLLFLLKMATHCECTATAKY